METTTPAPVPAPVTPTVNPREVLETILSGLGIPATIEVTTQNGTPLLLIATPEPGRIIGKRGQTLRQLQFLVNRITQRLDAAAPRVNIDCEGYRDQLREEPAESQTPTAPPPPPRDELLEKATEAAGKVRRWGDSILIGPYSPEERQRIHNHIATDPELETISEGGDETSPKKMIIRVRQSRR